MKIIKAILLCVITFGAVSQPSAWAHAGLKIATPAKDAQLTSAPTDISLKFNEKLEEGFSAIKVFDAAGHDVGAKKTTLDATDTSVLHAHLPVLKPGIYTVKWVAVGHDGHRRNGGYRFAVK